jgi:hypothetical protein
MRPIAFSAAIVMVVAACSPQTAPPRMALPEIGEYRPTQVNALDPDRVFPDDGSCALASARGARVRNVVQGYDAENVLELGDRIVEVDGTRVSSTAMLTRLTAGHTAGETLDLRVDRRGDVIDVSVQLSEGLDDGRPLIGIISDTDYRAAPLEDVPLVDAPVGDQRLVLLDGDVLLLDPINLEWQVLVNDAPLEAALAIVGSDVYTLTAPFQGTEIADVATGEVREIPLADWLFVRVLTSVGDLLLVSAIQGDAAAGTITATAVVAVDVAAETVVWIWDPGVSPDGELLLPDGGQVNHAGDLAAVSLASLGPDGAGQGRFHVFLDESGTERTDWRSSDRSGVLDNVIVGGFFSDGEVLVSGLTAQGWLVSTYSVATGSVTPLSMIVLEEGESPPRHLALGDSRYLLEVVGSGASLVDATNDLSVVQPIARNCSVVFGADLLRR